MGCSGRKAVVGRQWLCCMRMVDKIARTMGLLEGICMIDL